MNTNQVSCHYRRESIAAPLFLCGAVLLLAGCGGGSSNSSKPLLPQSYSILDLGTLPGGTSSSAAALNNKGQVVGTSTNASGNNSISHAFLWQNGQTTDLGTLAGGTFSSATGINDNGQVCGSSDSSVKDYQGLPIARAFVYSAGALTDLGTLLGDAYSGASAISADGTLAGLSAPPFISSPNSVGLSPSHAVLFRGGSTLSLGVLLGDTGSSASDINAAGQTVGESFVVGTYMSHAFLYSQGTLTPLGTLPGDIASDARAININAQAVGSSEADAGFGRDGRKILRSHAVLFAGGHVSDLGVLPGDTDSAATAINDSGQVLGVSENFPNADPAKAYHPFVWQQGQMVALNSRLPSNSGWILTGASGINNAGQICGSGLHNGQPRAFLLTPQ